MRDAESRSGGGTLARHRRRLLGAFSAALDAVGGRQATARFLRESAPRGPVYLAAVGKAAAAMAAGAADALGERIAAGLVLTKHGHLGTEPLPPRVRALESSHPVPDASSLAAGEALLRFAQECPRDSLFTILVSGGASSLVEVLPEGVPTDDLGRINAWLLASGLPIGAINRVRKRVSRIKGGRLAAACGATRALNLMISDVPGDDPKVVGSGLMVPHEPGDIDVTDLKLPDWLAELADRAPALSPAGSFAGVESHVIARPADARRASAAAARAADYVVTEHETLLEGDAAETGRLVVARLDEGGAALHVWNSETTVLLPEHPGRGGRCQTLALAAAIAIEGRDDVVVLAAGTDGTDGPGEDAGALVDGGTVARGRAAGLDPAASLRAADAGRFLAATGDLLSTGPTGTNVTDLILALRTG